MFSKIYRFISKTLFLPSHIEWDPCPGFESPTHGTILLPTKKLTKLEFGKFVQIRYQDIYSIALYIYQFPDSAKFFGLSNFDPKKGLTIYSRQLTRSKYSSLTYGKVVEAATHEFSISNIGTPYVISLSRCMSQYPFYVRSFRLDPLNSEEFQVSATSWLKRLWRKVRGKA